AHDGGDVVARRHEVVPGGRLVARTEPPQVDGDDAVPRSGHGGELGPPGPPELGVPAHEDHDRAGPGRGHADTGAVRRDEAVLPGALGKGPCCVGSVQRPGLIALTVSLALEIARCGTAFALAFFTALMPTSARTAAMRKSTSVMMR